MLQRLIFHCTMIAFAVASANLGASEHPPYPDPVPHDAINQPYRVCQDLEELTARINNLYRKPYHKILDPQGSMQPETIFFKDLASGHEVVCITRELCTDIVHGDLGRPAWTCDGAKILFMGTRGYRDPDGSFKMTPWPGHKYIMNADYSAQRALMVQYKNTNLDKDGKEVLRSAGIYGKYNTLDRQNPKYSYYAINDKFWRVTISDDDSSDHVAELLCTLATKNNKFIQDMSEDGKVLIQDSNAERDKQTGKPAYMPEIHLIDVNKKSGEPGFYCHHPFDYGLQPVADGKGKVIHEAANNFQFHSLTFGKDSRSICFNYGPMTDVGEPMTWTLDSSNGLDGTPSHGQVDSGAGVNPWGQYESHGKMIGGGSTLGLYFSGPAKLTMGDEKESGGWGIWLRDYADDKTPPRFITIGPGGHIAGGESKNPNIWAAHISAGWREKVKESDAIVWGRTTEATASVLCFTYSDVRGGTKTDRATGKIVWSGPNNNDYRPYSSIPRPLLSPDGTKLLFHSSMLQPSEDWVGMYVAAIQRPAPPVNLKLTGNAKSVQLEWQAPPVSHETKCYHVYRGLENENGRSLIELASLPAREKDGKSLTHYTDVSAQAGQSYTYALTSEEWSGLESDCTSNALKVKLTAEDVSAETAPALKGWDLLPPEPVNAFKATKEPDEDGQFRLNWRAAPEKDLRYYKIYFSTRGQPEINQKRLIASPLASMTSYLDWSAPIGTDVFYAITAVNRQGNESKPAYAEVKNLPVPK